MRKPLPMLSQLFFSFMKVGLVTFGGGYAMISVITDICVEKKRWLTQDEMMDLTVVAESTPGPIAINCATYVGYKMAGMTGAVLATLGIVLPSFVILYIISMFLEHFLEYKMIAAACRGIKVGVCKTSDVVLLFYTTSELYTKFGMVSGMHLFHTVIFTLRACCLLNSQ